MNIGKKLLELRKKKGLSQEEAADILNVTRQTISKWEISESKPDFDKIIPICDLYEITSDELILGKNKENYLEERTDNSNKKGKAIALSASIFLYFLSIIWTIIASSIRFISDEVIVGIFLLICAIATTIIVYYFSSHSKSHDKKKKNKYKSIDSIISILFLIIYLIISFSTMAWEITWIIWIVYALVLKIIHLLLDMKRGEFDEEK